MGFVFYADKKNLSKNGQSKEDQRAISTSKTNVREKSDKQSWGDSLGGIFKFIEWIDKTHVYRIFKFLPLSVINGWGHLIGKFGFGISSKVQRRITASMRALFPDFSSERIKQLSTANTKYMGMFLLDVLLRLPMICDFPPNTRVSNLNYLNFEKLDEALAKGKGVIVPIVHLGEHFHNPGGIFLHPQKYKMSVVASMKNLPMYEFNNRAHFDNLYIYASTKFANIKDKLRENLEHGHTLVMYHDYSSKSQLRVPFIVDKFPYLIHTPQSYIRLHKLTGAEILPLITVPDGTFGQSKLFFVDNTSIMKTSQDYWDHPDAEFHGRLSTEINRIMYPYVRQYAPYWEEIMRFAGLRCGDKIEFEKNCTLQQFLLQTKDKMIQILSNSWEPNRQDNQLVEKIEKFVPQIEAHLIDKTQIVRPHKSTIDLSLLSTKGEFKKLLGVLRKVLREKKETQAILHVDQLEKALNV